MLYPLSYEGGMAANGQDTAGPGWDRREATRCQIASSLTPMGSAGRGVLHPVRLVHGSAGTLSP